MARLVVVVCVASSLLGFTGLAAGWGIGRAIRRSGSARREGWIPASAWAVAVLTATVAAAAWIQAGSTDAATDTDPLSGVYLIVTVWIGLANAVTGAVGIILGIRGRDES